MSTATAGGPGSTMRAHPGHLAELDRTETEAYVPVCSCGWASEHTYSDVGEALADCADHMAHPGRRPA